MLGGDALDQVKQHATDRYCVVSQFVDLIYIRQRTCFRQKFQMLECLLGGTVGSDQIEQPFVPEFTERVSFNDVRGDGF